MKAMDKSKDNRNPFLRVKCPDCENEQIIFSCASSVVECEVCNKTLAEPSGGRAIIKSEILEKLE